MIRTVVNTVGEVADVAPFHLSVGDAVRVGHRPRPCLPDGVLLARRAEVQMFLQQQPEEFPAVGGQVFGELVVGQPAALVPPRVPASAPKAAREAAKASGPPRSTMSWAWCRRLEHQPVRP